jgi:dolichol-phosphate mannosyltransferase
MKISVIIPIKNEPLINELIKEVHRNLIDYKHEIIIIDKSDKKPNIIDAEFFSQKSDGLGNAVIEGFGYANGDVIITMDGDFSHNPKDLTRFVKKIKEGYDIVIGSRYVQGGSIKNWNPYRKITSKSANMLSSFLLGVNVNDITSNYRCYRKYVLNSIGLNKIKSGGYAFIQEILYLSKLDGFKIAEIPIVFVDREYGKSKLTKKEMYKFFIELLKLKLRNSFSLKK